jgi:branched-chain amino acid transport system ATP-binding protein
MNWPVRRDAVAPGQSFDPMLTVRNLCKRFGALAVTDRVSLTLAAGARHALIGPNGAGKTTFLGLLSGMLTPDSGTVHLEGQDITREPPSRRVKRGLVRTFQISKLFMNLTVFENFYLPCNELMGTSGRMLPTRRNGAVRDRADAMLGTLRLSELRDRLVSELSYGQQRLVELGIALCLEPKVLLLDEPAAGIPSGEVGIILTAIERLPPDIAVLLIEHDMQVVRRFAAEVTVLVSGSILISGTPNDVMESQEVRQVYLGRSGEQRLAGHRPA